MVSKQDVKNLKTFLNDSSRLRKIWVLRVTDEPGDQPASKLDRKVLLPHGIGYMQSCTASNKISFATYSYRTHSITCFTDFSVSQTFFRDSILGFLIFTTAIISISNDQLH